MKTKMKGQGSLETLPQAVIIFAVMIISLTIMTTVLIKVQVAQDTFSTVTNNKTLAAGSTPVNITQTLYGSGVRIKEYGVSNVYNASLGFVIPTTSYTFTDLGNESATFKLTNGTYNSSGMIIVFTNSASDTPLAYNITGAGLTANKTFSDFFDPIAVIVSAVVIIGLILGAFVYAKRGQGSSGV